MINGKRASFIIEALAIIIAILFLANYIRLTANNGFLTFEALIERCSQFSSIGMTTLIDLTITADWSIFNFLRDFINIFTSLFSVIMYLATNVMNSLWFIIQFVSIFFV